MNHDEWNYDEWDDGQKENVLKNKVASIVKSPIVLIVISFVVAIIVFMFFNNQDAVNNTNPSDNTPHTHSYVDGLCECGSTQDNNDTIEQEPNIWGCVNFCEWCGICITPEHYHEPSCECISIGLEFTSNEDGTCYVTGLGSCLDSNLRIPYVSPSGDIVIGIGSFAFEGKPIKSVAFPKTLTIIEHGAFSDCTKLLELTLPANLDYIDYNAFLGCTSLQALTLNSQLSTIKQGVFEDCSSLSTINFGSSDAELYLANSVFANCTSLTEVVIDRPIKLSPYVFEGCDNLTSVTFNKNAIVYTSFYQCQNLKIIIFKKDVEMTASISDLPQLEEVQFWGKITTKWEAISNCSNLKVVHLSNRGIEMSPRRINLFRDCNNITDIYFHGTEDQWDMLEFFEYDTDLKDKEINIHFV